MGKTEFRFFTDEDNQSLIYFQLPKVLMVAEKYKKMSNDAKLLYAYYLNLNTLSMERGWKDAQGHYYIKFKDTNAMAMLGCATEKFAKLKKELINNNLIHIVKTGQGKTNKTYVGKLEYTSADIYTTNQVFEQVADDADEADAQADLRKSKVSTESKDVRFSEPQTFENRKPRLSKIEKQDFRKSKTIIKNYSIKTHFRENDFKSSSSPVQAKSITAIVDKVSKTEEEEKIDGVLYNLETLGSKIAEQKLMLTNQQVTDTLNLIVEREMFHFDELDIERAIQHYKSECVKRKIVSPPLFFAKGMEIVMSGRYTYNIGSVERAEIERIKNLREQVPKIQFYNWLEERE